MSRPTSSTLHTIDAACAGCNWTSQARNALATAALHHDHTGHTININLTRRITYGDPHATPPGQLTIQEALTP